MQNKIDSEIKKIIDAGYKQAMTILKKMRSKLDLVAQELIKKETLESEDFEKLMGVRPSNAVLHRTFHALPPLTTKSGQQIGAIYGFISILLRTIHNIKPTNLAVTFDM